MADKNIYLEMMNDLIGTTTTDYPASINRVKDRCMHSSAKTTTLQSFFERDEQTRRFQQNDSVASEEQYYDATSDEDDEHNEFYEDDQDTVPSMLQTYHRHSSPFSSKGPDRHDAKYTSNSDILNDESMSLKPSPTKRYSSSSSKPKYNRSQMDGKQLDTLSMSLHTNDGTEVTATETEYSLNGSSHHSHNTTFSRSSNYTIPHSPSVRSNRMGDYPSPITVYRRSSIDETKMTDMEAGDILQTHHLLGEGYFGKVYLVNGPSDACKCPFALKKISKYHLLCEDQVHTVIREKEILQLCFHPNIVSLLATKQDASYLYLLQSFIPGGDMFSMIHHFYCSDSKESMGKPKNHPILSDETNVQFYTACIADALWYLHCGLSNCNDTSDRAVVYRDLKQENIMINERGYPILIDFGYAKILEVPSVPDENDINTTKQGATITRTYTMCGTAKYVSPEIIEGIGHTCSTDYWSLGVVVYELLTCGQDHPFEYMPNIDDLSLYRNVVEADYIPLPDSISTEAVDFVDKLLEKDLTLRLGATESGSYNPILLHPWIQKWDVSLLRQQSYRAPWIPKVLNPSDLSIMKCQSRNDKDENPNDDIEQMLNFDMDQQTDPNLTMKEQEMFADF
jgi:protein kinase A